jgi:alanine dehydrogenase
MVRDDSGEVTAIDEDGSQRPLVEVLVEADVIVNGILQDTDRPLMYLREGEYSRLKRESLIVDVSCDLGMGFPFARPTTFAEPTFMVGNATYYAVDHTPSYLWRSASWEISKVVVPYLEKVIGGPGRWEEDETLRRAIEIKGGEIRNPKILSFQQHVTN